MTFLHVRCQDLACDRSSISLASQDCCFHFAIEATCALQKCSLLSKPWSLSACR